MRVGSVGSANQQRPAREQGVHIDLIRPPFGFHQSLDRVGEQLGIAIIGPSSRHLRSDPRGPPFSSPAAGLGAQRAGDGLGEFEPGWIVLAVGRSRRLHLTRPQTSGVTSPPATRKR